MLIKVRLVGGLLVREPLKLLENDQTFRETPAGVGDSDRSCPQPRLIGEQWLGKDDELKQVWARGR